MSKELDGLHGRRMWMWIPTREVAAGGSRRPWVLKRSTSAPAAGAETLQSKSGLVRRFATEAAARAVADKLNSEGTAKAVVVRGPVRLPGNGVGSGKVARVPRLFSEHELQRCFKNALEAALRGDSQYFTDDGRQRRGSLEVAAFWDGFNAVVVDPMDRTVEGAYYQAGVEFKRRRGAEIKRPPGKPASGRARVVATFRITALHKERLGVLGRDWLESAIDAGWLARGGAAG